MPLSDSDRQKIEALPWDFLSRTAAQMELSLIYLAACCLVESGGDNYAIRFEPGWKYFLKNMVASAKKAGISQATEKMGQATSWGPMQIMGSVARELGFTGSFPELCGQTGIYYGALVLKKKMKQYGNITDAISAYNAGSSQRIKKSAAFRNQAHVDRFLYWTQYVDQYLMIKDSKQ